MASLGRPVAPFSHPTLSAARGVAAGAHPGAGRARRAGRVVVAVAALAVVTALVVDATGCARGADACMSAADCPGLADLCRDGACVSLCNDASECRFDETCSEGVCAPCPECARGDGAPVDDGDDKGAPPPSDGGDDEVPDVDLSPWWDEAFAARMRLFIDGSALTEDLVDFPVLVALDPDRFDYAAARADGADLRFVDDDGALLAHEVERFSPGYQSAVWVRVPAVAAGATTTIRLYFGAPDGVSIEPSFTDAAAVWDDAFEAVHHFGDALTDSTTNDVDGSADGTSRVIGDVGPARAFDGQGSIDLGADRELLRGTGAATISMLVSLTPDVAGPQVLVGIGVSGAAPTGVSRATIEVTASDALRAGGRALDDEALQSRTTIATMPRDGWHHVAARVSYADGSIEIFLDGEPLEATGTIAFGASTTADTPSASSRLGADDDGEGWPMDGMLDEVRISRTARSTSWLRAEAHAARDALVTYAAVQAR